MNNNIKSLNDIKEHGIKRSASVSIDNESPLTSEAEQESDMDTELESPIVTDDQRPVRKKKFRMLKIKKTGQTKRKIKIKFVYELDDSDADVLPPPSPPPGSPPPDVWPYPKNFDFVDYIHSL